MPSTASPVRNHQPKLIQLSRPAPHVLLLTIARPPVNAFNTALWNNLREAFDGVVEFGGEEEVRCVVLAGGVGKGLTAGLDLSDPDTAAIGAGTEDPARTSLELRRHILDFQDAISSLARCRVPVVVAIHGLCVGLGCDIISAADVRLCSSDAKFSVREVAIGMAADIGTLQRLPKIAGNDSLVRELCLTGRFFDASTAARVGLVSRVVSGGKEDVLREALDVAREIARWSPVATVGTKHLLNHARDHTIAEGLEYTALWNSVQLQTADLSDSVKAFASKTAGQPSFRPLKARL